MAHITQSLQRRSNACSNAGSHFSRRFVMGLILLEALGALLLLVLIVWWTMFSGRKKGELPRDDQKP
jgi:hypothetical protein